MTATSVRLVPVATPAVDCASAGGGEPDSAAVLLRSPSQNNHLAAQQQQQSSSSKRKTHPGTASPGAHAARDASIPCNTTQRSTATETTSKQRAPRPPPVEARTQERMTTSSCLPWKESTVSMKTCNSKSVID